MNPPTTALPERVTITKIQEVIANVDYVYDDLLTLCIMTLRNGFKVVGLSACVSREIYNRATGEHYAYQDAFDKVWPLEGYLLADKHHQSRATDGNV